MKTLTPLGPLLAIYDSRAYLKKIYYFHYPLSTILLSNAKNTENVVFIPRRNIPQLIKFKNYEFTDVVDSNKFTSTHHPIKPITNNMNV